MNVGFSRYTWLSKIFGSDARFGSLSINGSHLKTALSTTWVLTALSDRKLWMVLIAASALKARWFST
jgi:hypothetical protein